jgi:hypothetical protein
MRKFIFSIFIFCISAASSVFAQAVGDDYLNDLINLWNAKKYDKVYQPLKEYKAGKKISGDFDIDYMIASSASRANLKQDDVRFLMEDILKDYKLSPEDAAFITEQATPKKYALGQNKRMDAERIANRGKGEKNSKEVPRSLGKGDGKVDEMTGGDKTDNSDLGTGDTQAVKDNKDGKGKPTNGAVKGGDIIRKSGITQIVKGDMVITVKPGWSYIVRNDSIFTIPPPRPKK